MPAGYDSSTTKRGVSMGGPGKGKKGFFVELPEELADAFRGYARGRGESIGTAVARALRREMQNPPPVVVDPPLPPLVPAAEPKKKGKGSANP